MQLNFFCLAFKNYDPETFVEMQQSPGFAVQLKLQQLQLQLQQPQQQQLQQPQQQQLQQQSQQQNVEVATKLA